MSIKLPVRLALATAVSTMVAMPTVASAASISYSADIPTGGGTQFTNFDEDFFLTKFDPSLGTLLSVNVMLTGTVEGSAAAESRDAAPSTVTLDLSAGLTLTETTTGQELAFVQPLVKAVEDFTAFDGTIDFGGTSGATHTGLTATEMDSQTYMAPAILALFTGPGDIQLNLDAMGMSTASGAGNLITEFSTLAGASAKVTYEYEPVPEPLTILGAGAAISFGAGFKRKLGKNNKKK
ncbi:PEP-CTERM sorting domain-containing protein [Crocosphaera sp.]|uniref:PEP-CTERM sorting domain-containing protein n=1 Tax=Crocosphaera sp. TaxID=2729996 RepID=UPI003F1FE7C1